MTLEILGALHARGIPAVVLKGPSIARWLYEPKTDRLYEDSDLLVAPDRMDDAGRVMFRSGFRTETLIPSDQPWYARTWTRDDGSIVELHRTLWGIEVSPTDAWRQLAGRTESMALANGTIQVLDVPARAMHVALHAAQHGMNPKPLEDLRRAVIKLPMAVWREAYETAQALEASKAFAAGLELVADGEPISTSLGLVAERTVELHMRAEGASRHSLTLGWIMSQRSWQARSRAIAHKVFPPREFVREKHAEGRDGPRALAMGYIRRVIWLGKRTPSAFRTWRNAKRRTSDD